MQIKDVDTIDDLKKAGILIKEKNSVLNNNTKYLSVRVDIGFPMESNPDILDFDVIIVDSKGQSTYLTDFNVITKNNQKVFTFNALQEMPSNIPTLKSDNIVTAYLDLSWNLGTSVINENMTPIVSTIKDENSRHLDLGWVLPSRFVDSVIPSLGVLNVAILGGMIEEALIYGPILREGK